MGTAIVTTRCEWLSPTSQRLISARARALPTALPFRSSDRVASPQEQVGATHEVDRLAGERLGRLRAPRVSEESAASAVIRLLGALRAQLVHFQALSSPDRAP
jgi:hypothetical protein